MKEIGTVSNYNGRKGIILNTNNEEVDFSFSDLSSLDIQIGDKVEYRCEAHEYNIKIARNIQKL